MFGRHRKHQSTDFVEPDLPITPMLDMSFQLMAFFIFTFRPAPTEGQLALALPKEVGGPSTSIPSPIQDEQPVKLTVAVQATGGGKIGDMYLRDEQGAAAATRIGPDVQTLLAELKKRGGDLKGRPGKLTYEIDPSLIQVYVIQLLDVGTQAGFEDIATILPPENKK